MFKRKQSKIEKLYVTVSDASLVPMAYVTERVVAPLPKWLGECFVCARPAIGILCGRSDYGELPIKPIDPDIKELFEDLRAQLHSNFEMPVCDAHVAQAVPN